MGLTIANNVASLNAQHNLTRANERLTTSVERLSSGLKINRGADGPAALVISEKQRAQIAGLEKAIENSEKAVSLVQTAEGALGEINALLVKVRSLAVDSANTGINDADALAANQAEITNALDTINRVANNTQFLTKKLFEGSSETTGVADDADVTVLDSTSETLPGTYAVEITQGAVRANIRNYGLQTQPLGQNETLTINGVDVSLTAGLNHGEVLDRINEFTDQTGVRAFGNNGDTYLYSVEFGSSATISVISDVAFSGSNTTGFDTSLRTDTGVDITGTIGGDAATGIGNTLTSTAGDSQDLSLEFAANTLYAPIYTDSGSQGSVTVSETDTSEAFHFQIGANTNQTAEIQIGNVNASSLGKGVSGNQFRNLNEIDVTSATGAQDALAVVDDAIDDITNLRGKLGAFQSNTLTATANNLRTTLENTVNAESVIRDTDFAAEIANFTQQQVLVQAGTSVLGNANQLPQLVLSLLQ